MIAHGPQAESLAALYLDLLQRWAWDHRRRGTARIEYRPLTDRTGLSQVASVAKRHGLLSVSWH